MVALSALAVPCPISHPSPPSARGGGPGTLPRATAGPGLCCCCVRVSILLNHAVVAAVGPLLLGTSPCRGGGEGNGDVGGLRWLYTEFLCG